MSWISSWWSKKEDESESDSASSSELLQTLTVKRMKLMQEINKLDKSARVSFKAGNKQHAGALLKQKTILDTRLKQLDGQIAVTRERSMIHESAAMSLEMAKTSRAENEKIKAFNEQIDIGDVDEIAIDFQEQSQQTFEISQALSQPSMSSYTPCNVDDQIFAQMEQWANEGKEPEPTPPVVASSPAPDGISDELLDMLEKTTIETSKQAQSKTQ